MRTLAELRHDMSTDSTEQKLTAATEISNFRMLYTEEYNLLLNKEVEAKVAHYDATHNTTGIDHHLRLELEALMTSIVARKAMLDMQMTAVFDSRIGIVAPSQAVIDNVKKLTTLVSAAVLRDKAITSIVLALGDIARLVNGTMAPVP